MSLSKLETSKLETEEKIAYQPFWLCARKFKMASGSKKAIKITKCALNSLK